MRVSKVLIIAGGMTAPLAATAADYRAAYHEPRVYSASPGVYAAPAYVPYVPPVTYLPSPPQYVQDMRTGYPGHWEQLKPSLMDQLFGRLGDGY